MRENGLEVLLHTLRRLTGPYEGLSLLSACFVVPGSWHAKSRALNGSNHNVFPRVVASAAWRFPAVGVCWCSGRDGYGSETIQRADLSDRRCLVCCAERCIEIRIPAGWASCGPCSVFCLGQPLGSRRRAKWVPVSAASLTLSAGCGGSALCVHSLVFGTTIAVLLRECRDVVGSRLNGGAWS